MNAPELFLLGVINCLQFPGQPCIFSRTATQGLFFLFFCSFEDYFISIKLYKNMSIAGNGDRIPGNSVQSDLKCVICYDVNKIYLTILKPQVW